MKEPIMKLKQATSNVLETMFFEPIQFVEHADTLENWFCGNRALIGATLNFVGPSSGIYLLLIPGRLVKEITANFLGLSEAAIDLLQQKDTVKEALNMIGGHMLSLFDAEGEYQLGIPDVIAENDLHKVFDKKGEYIFMETNEDRLAAGIVLE